MYDLGRRTDDYVAKCVSSDRVFYAKFIVNGIEYDDKYINKISFNHSFDDSNYRIGCTPSATLQMELNNFEGELSSSNFENKEITIRIGMEMGDDDWIEVPMGLFIATDVKKDREIIHINAYDRMITLDKKADITISTPYSFNQLLEAVAIMGNFEVGNDVVLPFGSVMIDEDINFRGWTYRQIIGYIAEINGCNAFFNKEDKLRISNLTPVKFNVFPKDLWFSLALSEKQFNGYDGLIINYLYDDSKADDDFIYYINDNPFAKYMSNEDMRNLSGILSEVNYTGYEIDFCGIPIIEINDKMSIQNTDGYMFIAPIISLSWNYSGGFEMTSSATNPNKTKEEAEANKQPITQVVENLVNGKNEEFNKTIEKTIVEVTKESVVAADIIEASSAFIEDIFVERLETNIKAIKCIPNIRKNEKGEYEWVDGEKSYIIPQIANNIRPYIRIEGICLKFIEAHLSESGTVPLQINGKQVYYTSIADAENAYQYFTFVEPKSKYPSMSDDNAEMFKVMIRKSDAEYEKAEFKFDMLNADGVTTFNPKLIIGTGDEAGNGKLIYEKMYDEAMIYLKSRTEEGRERGISIKDDGLYQIRGKERGILPFITISETEPSNPEENDIWIKPM